MYVKHVEVLVIKYDVFSLFSSQMCVKSPDEYIKSISRCHHTKRCNALVQKLYCRFLHRQIHEAAK